MECQEVLGVSAGLAHEHPDSLDQAQTTSRSLI
jgi:hypothetical protein